MAMPSLGSIKVLSVFPSQRFPLRPTSPADSAKFDPPPPTVFPSSVGVAPVAPPPTILPDRLFQNDRPNIPPTVVHRPEDVPPPGRSYPGLPKAPHGDDDRSEIPPSGESHLAVRE